MVDRLPAPSAPLPPGPTSAGNRVLNLRIEAIRQIYNSMDPAPFRERDLDPDAVAYILDWANQGSGNRPMELHLQISTPPAHPQDLESLQTAVLDYFGRRAQDTRLQLHRLFRNGRISLLIGLGCLALAILIGEFISLIVKESYATLIRETLVIGGWVALWRPMEIFLYDWWPVRSQVNLFRRLSEMPIYLTVGHPKEST